MRKNYLLLLIPPVPFGRWICGTGLFCLLFLFFKLNFPQNMPSATLFFTLIISYIIPIYSYISDQSVQALEDLKDELSLTAAEFARTKQAITHTTFKGNVIAPAGGLVFALFHQWLIYGTLFNISRGDENSAQVQAGFIGTILIWIVMTSVIMGLINNARIFSQLGKHQVKIDLFQTYKLLPFARIAIISTLALVGALALFPILLLDSESPLTGALPGFLATAIPVFIMLAIPIWPIHKRLLQAKEKALTDIRELIREHTGGPDPVPLNAGTVTTLAPLLAYQRSLVLISTWPFDLSALTRLAFYLIIPPLTWVGAALIEKGLDLVL